jgi:molybdate transport system ATP-binding protein
VPTPGPDSPDIRAHLRLARGRFDLAVDLDLPARGVTVISGPSGSGKTTCLRLLAGLERGRGMVQVGHECWQDDARGIFVPPHRRSVGYVFQDHALFSHLSIRENLDYGRRRHRGPRWLEPASVIDLLGVAHLLERRPDALSGGERQRAAIAQVVLREPRILFMDEPLSSLDRARKIEVLPFLERLCEGLSIPVLYVTHSVEEISRLADRLVILEAGRVAASGSLSEILMPQPQPRPREDAFAFASSSVEDSRQRPQESAIRQIRRFP